MQPGQLNPKQKNKSRNFSRLSIAVLFDLLTTYSFDGTHSDFHTPATDTNINKINQECRNRF